LELEEINTRVKWRNRAIGKKWYRVVENWSWRGEVEEGS
jgi:hypothetical protein